MKTIAVRADQVQVGDVYFNEYLSLGPLTVVEVLRRYDDYTKGSIYQILFNKGVYGVWDENQEIEIIPAKFANML